MNVRPLLLCLALCATACGKQADAPAAAVRVVNAMTVGESGVQRQRTFGGDIRARHETQAGFRVGGKLLSRLDAGTAVSRGQVLAQLDPVDLQLRVADADARARRADADAARLRALRARNFIGQAAVDEAEAARAAADAEARMARNQASYATLAADRDGVVAEVLAQAGQVVAAGQAVLRMAWDGEREVAIAVPEDAMDDVAVGGEAQVALWADPATTWRGTVREISPQADGATRTHGVRVRLPDAVNPPLGHSARVTLRTGAANAIVVPMSSLFQSGDQPAVWVIAGDGTIELRAVRVATYADDGVHVVAGLAAGERIVTAGANRLHAGERVRIAADAASPGSTR